MAGPSGPAIVALSANWTRRVAGLTTIAGVPPEAFVQHIPRPDTMLRRPSAPWNELSPALRRHIPLEVIERTFPIADARGATTGPARAAVLAGVIGRDDEAQIILTRRSFELVRDPGLIAFPGGYVEANEHPLDAALRESFEEIGLESRCVDVRDYLGSIERLSSKEIIVSYVGLVSSECSFNLNPDEVESLILVPLRDLMADGAGWQEEWGAGESMRVVHFFASDSSLGNNVVWGVTAKILWDVVASVANVLGQS